MEIYNVVVDGVWGPWSTWSECTKTCSGGVTERFRQCNNPAPKFGGKRCAGNRTETLPCNEQGCPGSYQHINEYYYQVETLCIYLLNTV